MPGNSIRVLLVNTLYTPYALGGAERSVRELAEGLTDLGHEVCLLTLQEQGGNLPEHEVIDGVRIERVTLPRAWPFGPKWSELSSVAKVRWHFTEDIGVTDGNRIRAVLRDFEPDLINTHNIAGFGSSIWHEFAGRPLIHTIRDYYLACLRTTLYRSDHLCERRCTDCSLLTTFRKTKSRLPDAFIGVSKRVLQIHSELQVLPTQTSQYVVYNSPAPSKASQPTSDLKRFREKHDFVFGFMGRPEPAKGLPLILNALKSSRLRGVGLVIAGVGRSDQTTELATLARDSNAIYFAGRLSPSAYLGAIDAALVPTQWEEPFGRVAMEARSANIPIIASRMGGLPEVLHGYQPTILIDNPSSTAAWSEAMVSVSERGTNRKYMDEGILCPETSGDIKGVAAQYAVIYNDVLAGRK